jgi:small-conductance mechanosensitive channel
MNRRRGIRWLDGLRLRGMMLALVLSGGVCLPRAQAQNPLPVATQPVSTQQATPHPVAHAPVEVRGKTLFEVQGILSFSAEARAEAISKRISELSTDVTFDPKSITVSDGEGTADIVAGDLVLMSVTDLDARGTGMTRQALAADDAQRIRVGLRALRRDYSAKSLALGGVYTLVATLVLMLIFRLMAFGFPRLVGRVEGWRGTKIRSVRIQGFELLPAERITDFAIGLGRLLRFAVILVVLYFYASLVLGFFPWTRGYAQVLLAYTESSLKVIGHTVLGYLPNLLFVAVIVVLAHYVTKFTRVIFQEIGKGSITFSGFHPEWAKPTFKIVRFLIVAVTVIAAFPYLPGSESPAFKGISLFLGVLFSLGSTSAVANVVSGVILTYMRAFRLGDRVQIADTVGDVIEVSLLVTRVRTIKNVEVTIANSMVLSSHIINFSGSVREEKLILHTTVTIGYDAPWRKIHELLLAAAGETENVLKAPAPFVLQTALDDFYVHYQINAYTDQPSRMAQTYSQLHGKIQDKFFEAGVEIMSPHHSTIRDGNRVAIPEDYLGKDYVAPVFRVGVEGAGRQDRVKDGGS